MKRFLLFIWTLVLGISLTGCNTLPRHSEENIGQRVLQDTPFNSTYGTVLDYAKSKEWPVKEYGTNNIDKVPLMGLTGKRAIQAFLGSYQGFPWKMNVNFYWIFDGDKLVKIFVEKQEETM